MVHSDFVARANPDQPPLVNQLHCTVCNIGNLASDKGMQHHADCNVPEWSCTMQEAAQEALAQYSMQVTTQYEAHMAAKLGLHTYNKDLAVGLMSNMYEDSTGTAASLCSGAELLAPAARCCCACTRPWLTTAFHTHH